MEKSEGLLLRFLYKTMVGRVFLRILISPFISKIGGFILSTKISKLAVKRFAKKNHIDCQDYYVDNIKSFNDFFARRVREEKRPIDRDEKNFISPADGHLSFYKIGRAHV